MAQIERPNPMTVRLSDEEERLRDALELHLGIDGSGVMRQGLLRLGRAEGFTLPLTTKSPDPKGPSESKK